ncbi:MAG: hypothetical protein AAFX45_09955 [Pseudomonadota bacterium]
MDPVEEFARIKNEIKALKAREQELRQGFLDGARLRSNAHEVVVKTQKRKVFLRDRLPGSILDDPSFWEERETQVVSVRALDDDVVLIETD